MKKTLLLSLVAASVLAAGCESVPTNTSVSKDEGEVITGSRIPRKDSGSSGSVGTMSQDAYKQDRASGSR